MHVGVDLLFLVPGQSGGRETYVRELLPALRAAEPGLRLTAFAGREAAAAGEGFWTDACDRVVVLPRASALARARWAAGELLLLPRAADRAGVDVLHCPANFAPWHGRCARVLTLHDVMWRRVPDAVPAAMRAATDVLVPRGARRADRVITGAAAAKADIVAELGVDPERIDVVPHGLGSPVVPGDAARGRTLAGAGPGRGIVLCVATDVPHKNLGALVEIVAAIEQVRRPLLVLAGHGTDGGRLDALAAARGAGADVRTLGAVTQGDLEDLYAAATVLATPTRFEGFGLPVLEAMARGVPVLCPDLPVLREVAGDDAAWLKPAERASAAEILRDLLADDAQRARMAAAGRERAARFTWAASARGTLESYERALAVAASRRR
ncbi:MAG TPA: glycosyltransferase family 1 protein [Solirubrobacteraceae bacterium]|nr:glycosyltransferase family 1 protein [Solirubrobacteraceae bacterium]